MPCGAIAGRHMFLMQHLRALFTYQALRGISDRPPRARSDIAYLNSRDATIMGSRNGHAPIYMWYTLTRKGYEGMRKDVERCLRNAHLLKARPLGRPHYARERKARADRASAARRLSAIIRRCESAALKGERTAGATLELAPCYGCLLWVLAELRR